MIRANRKLPGSSDSTTPMTRVFATKGASEESMDSQDVRDKADGCYPASCSSRLSVEMHRDEKDSSRSPKKNVPVDI